MPDITPDQARSALAGIDSAHRHVADEIGLPRAYWWAMAGGWIALGAVGDLCPPWAVTVATVAFGAGHAIVASRLLDGRRANPHVRVTRALTDRRIPLIVIGILVTAVAVTIGLGFALAANGAADAAIWASVIVAAIIGFGGPDIFRVARRWLGA